MIILKKKYIKILLVHSNKRMKKTNKYRKEQEEWFKRLKGFAPTPDLERALITSTARLQGQKIGRYAGRLEGAHQGVRNFMESDSPQYRVDVFDHELDTVRTVFKRNKADVSRFVEEETGGTIPKTTISSRFQKMDPETVSFTVEPKMRRRARSVDYGSTDLPSTIIRPKRIVVTSILPSLRNTTIFFDPNYPIRKEEIKEQWRDWALRGL